MHRLRQELAERGRIKQLAPELHSLDRRIYWKGVNERRNCMLVRRRIVLTRGAVNAVRKLRHHRTGAAETRNMVPRQVFIAVLTNGCSLLLVMHATKHAPAWHHGILNRSSEPYDQRQRPGGYCCPIHMQIVIVWPASDYCPFAAFPA